MYIDTAILLLAIAICYIGWRTFDKIIFPIMVKKGTKEISRNPNWVTSQLQYYGFHDIDIVVCNSKWGMLPRFKLNNKENKLEFWIDEQTPTRDIEELGRLALAGKIKIKYHLWFPEKPIYWLSILCYMLDGGDIQMQAISWKEKQETS